MNEPASGATVVDRHGTTWTRGDRLWWTDHGTYMSWDALNEICGPLTEVTE